MIRVSLACPTQAADTLRSRGMRMTPQRRAVLDVMCGNTSHPSVEEVASAVESRLPGVSRSTIYHTLHEFAALGLLAEFEVDGVMRFDPDSSAHAHVVCLSCGSVSDAALPSGLEAQLAGLVPEMDVSRIEVTLRGSCQECRADRP